MKFVKQKKTHTGREKYQFRIEGFIGDTEFSNMLKFLTESFGPSSIYPLLKTFPQPGNESWTWLHRITQKLLTVIFLSKTILFCLFYYSNTHNLHHNEFKNRKTAIFTHSPHSRILNFEVNYIAIDALRWFIERGMIPSITKKHGMKVKFKTSEQFNEFKMAHPDLKIVVS